MFGVSSLFLRSAIGFSGVKAKKQRTNSEAGVYKQRRTGEAEAKQYRSWYEATPNKIQLSLLKKNYKGWNSFCTKIDRPV